MTGLLLNPGPVLIVEVEAVPESLSSGEQVIAGNSRKGCWTGVLKMVVVVYEVTQNWLLKIKSSIGSHQKSFVCYWPSLDFCPK